MSFTINNDVPDLSLKISSEVNVKGKTSVTNAQDNSLKTKPEHQETNVVNQKAVMKEQEMSPVSDNRSLQKMKVGSPAKALGKMSSSSGTSSSKDNYTAKSVMLFGVNIAEFKPVKLPGAEADTSKSKPKLDIDLNVNDPFYKYDPSDI
ncbi:hypothetical protein QQ045_022568 [Rhodiola kirilowii]